jgi:hypothetical protein
VVEAVVRVKQVILAAKVPLAQQDRKDLLVVAAVVKRVILAVKAIQATQAQLDHRVQLERLAQQDHKDPLAAAVVAEPPD